MPAADSKHTQGPWTNSTDGTLPIRIKAPSAVEWKDSQTIVAHVGDSQHAPIDFKESVANARLIAAAPDLLAALGPLAMAARAQHDAIMIRARVQEGDIKRESIEAASRWLALHNVADAAIAKAEGG